MRRRLAPICRTISATTISSRRGCRRLNSELGNWLVGRIKAGAQYALLRRGPLVRQSQPGEAVSCARRLPATRPNIQLYFCPLAYEKTVAGQQGADQGALDASLFSLSASPCRPLSRGSVRLRGADAGVAPEIQPNLLAAPEDMAEIVEAAQLMRRYATTKALGDIIRSETKPGPAVQAAGRVRGLCEGIEPIRFFHPSGTCRMGPDARVLGGRRHGCGSTGLVGCGSLMPRSFPTHLLSQHQRAHDDGGGEGAGVYSGRRMLRSRARSSVDFASP